MKLLHDNETLKSTLEEQLRHVDLKIAQPTGGADDPFSQLKISQKQKYLKK